jgi:predicted ATPase with chaperone activity
MLMVGPPGSGKSMLAQRLPSILPPLSPRELLEVSMIASIAGELSGGKLTDRRPFPRAAPFRLDGRDGRRRSARPARRGFAGA